MLVKLDRISPGIRGENKQYLKPPPSYAVGDSYPVGLWATYIYHKTNKSQLNVGKHTTPWWLNQSLWKIWVKLDHFPNFRGENFKNVWVATSQLFWGSAYNNFQSNQPLGPRRPLVDLLEHLKKNLSGSIIYNHIWLVVSTHLKNISKNGNLPQIGMKIKNI